MDAIAINGHGTNLLREGEVAPDKATYGTLSNTIVELSAIVWEEATRSYVQRTYQRRDPEIAALMVNLGRIFVTDVVLQTVPNYNIRCRNFTHIHQRILFAPPEKADGQSLSALVNKHGRVGIIWFAMTDYPWIQVWEVSPTRPLASRPVHGPYNYPFADNLPDKVAEVIAEVTQGAGALTPAMTSMQADVTTVGLTATGARDMWGEAKNFINFVKPTTLRVSAGSHVVIVRRADVQRLVSEFTQHYLRLISDFRERGLYPANNTCEIRITGLDQPGDMGIAGAQTAALSGAAPVPGRPELDTAVWLDVLNLPGTPNTDELFMGLERWFADIPADFGIARPEWAKRFATTAAGSWTDTTDMRERIPAVVPGWHDAVATFERLDPRGVFRSPLHERLMLR